MMNKKIVEYTQQVQRSVAMTTYRHYVSSTGGGRFSGKGANWHKYIFTCVVFQGLQFGGSSLVLDVSGYFFSYDSVSTRFDDNTAVGVVFRRFPLMFVYQKRCSEILGSNSPFFIIATIRDRVQSSETARRQCGVERGRR